jgi:aryl-alcohol dehydrogenase-like predicted oxidoreductase
LARGLVTATVEDKDQLAEDDFRRTLPRFDDDHWQNNKRLVDELAEFAHSKNSTPAQIALAWVLAQGDDMIPIPGTKHRKYLEENAVAVNITLSADDLDEIENILHNHPNVGNRYSEGSMKLVNQ